MLNAGVCKQSFPSSWSVLPFGTIHDLLEAETDWLWVGKTVSGKLLRNAVVFTGQSSLNVIAEPLLLNWAHVVV